MYSVADELRINSPDTQGAAILTSQSVWGVLRGLETFSQLLTQDETGTAVSVSLVIMRNYSVCVDKACTTICLVRGFFFNC